MSVTSATTQQTIRDWYQSAIDGDIENFFSLVSDSLELHEPPGLPYGKVYHGISGFQELFAGAAELLDLSTLAIESVSAQDDHAWAVVSVNMRHSGERATIAEEWRLADGKIVWGRVYWFNFDLLPAA